MAVRIFNAVLSKAARIALPALLPKSEKFWRIYTSYIPILKDSEQLRTIREKLTLGLDLKMGDRFLDAGCGTGQWLVELAGKVSYMAGLDIEEGMLEQARARIGREVKGGSTRIDLVAGTMEKIPFPDNHFDAIGSTLVLGYVDDWRAALRELFRTLKGGGRLGLVTPGSGARFSRVLKAEARSRRERGELFTGENLKKLAKGAVVAYVFGKMAELKAAAGQWRFFQEDELVLEIKKAGFSVVRIERAYAGQAILLIAQKPRDTAK